MSGLGALEHAFSYGSDSVVVPHLANFESTEQAPGGVMSASGDIAQDLLRRHPDVFRYGATWRSRIAGTKETRFGGRLLDPSPSQGRVTLVARGWGAADKVTATSRFMPQTRDYSAWTGLDAEPFGANGNGFAVADAITTIVGRGRLRIKIDGAGNADPASADIVGTLGFRNQNGLLAWFPGVDIRRIAFHVEQSGAVQPGVLELAVLKSTGTNGPLTLVQDGSNPYPLGLGNPLQRNIDLRLSAQADIIAIVVRNMQATNQWARQATGISITDLRVNGIGYDDTYAASVFVSEVFSRLGLRDYSVGGNGTNTLPFDLEDNAPFADALDYVNMLTGWRHRIIDLNDARFGEWGPWGPVWDVPDDARDEFVPLDRYDAVRVPFQTSGGQQDEVYVSNPKAISEVPNVFEDIVLAGPQPTKSVALDLANAVLPIVTGRRAGGTGFLTEVIVPGTSDRVSAHYVQAGDVLRYPHYDNLLVKVADLRRTNAAVEYTPLERIPGLDRLIARFNRRQHLRGRY